MEINVLQWNIWFAEDVRKVADFLLQNKADVICLQELTIGHSPHVDNAPEYIAQRLGYNFYYKDIPIESTDGSSITLANGIFSRFPVKAHRFSWINEPNSGGGYDDEYRAYVEVTLEIEGRPVTVATTHMSYTHKFEPTPNKQAETDKLIAELAMQKAHYIFTGDLNALPDSPTIQAIGAHLKNAGPTYDEKTWATKSFSYRGFSEKALNWRLDYVFTTHDITPVSGEIIKTDLSDHLPVRVTLRLP